MNGTIVAQIELVRWKMIESGLRLGLDSPTTIQLSKELDALINIHQRNDTKKTTHDKIIQ
ncbi:aspartyl-phosphate phosphatase Spo0E family protein [Rossellomorea vietnamensis]|uniref:aspartyl-phosphate phosphatase Spo0E family protein n=1 Tax=Rossellomorea vietnamensis TaxID=218284 RepID=UPI00226E9E7B|nr:aspartyl-phosphate phosphatase Spo0E family protein [Rossellomorea vietnamensis]MCC5802553.1 aspartyl-phosphate phosphatase Spo0E family protein [Rossellomorea vietnamensis]